MRCPGRASRRWVSSSKNPKVVRGLEMPGGRAFYAEGTASGEAGDVSKAAALGGGGDAHEVGQMMGALGTPVRTLPFTLGPFYFK